MIMLYRTLLKLKERNGLTDDLKNKIDIFFATGRITEEQYNELMDINKEEEPKVILYKMCGNFGRERRVKGEHRLSFLSTERRNYGKSNF